MPLFCICCNENFNAFIKKWDLDNFVTSGTDTIDVYVSLFALKDIKKA
jgi:hypothetical protein